MTDGGVLHTQIGYILLIFALFVVPRALQRWRIPSAITSLVLGAAASMGLGWYVGDQTVHLLSTLGIVALFLFAGLEVDGRALRADARIVTQHVVIRVAIIAGVAYGATRLYGFETRPAVLFALALLSPSTGFILSSLPGFGLSPEEARWVKAKAIATEIVALLALFVVLQSATVQRLSLSVLALIALVAGLPLLLRAFASWIAPFAPRSEFAFLVMLAVVCASVTRALGAYYLVGAFVVGVAAGRLREKLPALASEQMLIGVELFASFFIPFYFFNAGLEMQLADFSPMAVLMAAVFLAVGIPLGMGSVMLHRWLTLRERPEHSRRVALAMVPTLVFTLVLAQILRDAYQVPAPIIGGLLIYTVVNTMLPGIVLRTVSVSFEHSPTPPRAGD